VLIVEECLYSIMLGQLEKKEVDPEML